jgi:hypothetical protein
MIFMLILFNFIIIIIILGQNTITLKKRQVLRFKTIRQIIVGLSRRLVSPIRFKPGSLNNIQGPSWAYF